MINNGPEKEVSLKGFSTNSELDVWLLYIYIYAVLTHTYSLLLEG